MAKNEICNAHTELNDQVWQSRFEHQANESDEVAEKTYDFDNLVKATAVNAQSNFYTIECLQWEDLKELVEWEERERMEPNKVKLQKSSMPKSKCDI